MKSRLLLALFVVPLAIAPFADEASTVPDPSPMALVVGCSPANTKTANDIQDAVLRGKDLACVMGSLVISPEAVAKACGIADKLETLLPILRGLIGVREAARRAGVTYQPTASDAGASTDASVGADAAR